MGRSVSNESWRSALWRCGVIALGTVIGAAGLAGCDAGAAPTNAAAGAVSTPEAASSAAPAAGIAAAATEPAGAPALWVVDWSKSHIRFAGTQAGAEFEGGFSDFQAAIRFDPAQLPQSSARVKIDLRSVGSGNEERDELMRGVDWFAVEQWSQAEFMATQFTAESDGTFAAHGALQIRDTSQPVVLTFSVTELTGEQSTANEIPARRLRLHGTAELARLAFGLGQGEWQDTEWVADLVTVEVLVVATVDATPR